MGKKLTPSNSMKLSKQEEKKQLNSLIKVLKPKVFITDSSRFKNLVQELTGFQANVRSTSPPPDNPMPCHHVQSFPVLEIQEENMFPESSFEFSVDSGSTSSGKQEMEFSEYKDIESWLLEIDQFQNYDTYAPPMAHLEVCDYNYDFSGFL